jgi:hypothetical protein
MTDFPIPLDNLISYVHSFNPDGGPLDNLADAMAVSSRLDDEADALLGHFVDRARRSGASWTEIGSRMGVSKQAARKRFVPRWDGSDPIPEGQLYSRFTPRSRNTLLAAGRIAEQAGAQQIDAKQLAAGLLSEPDGLAARIIHGTGLGDEQLYAALELTPAPPKLSETMRDLYRLRFDEDAKAALRGTLTAVLRLGHNYVGTEHLLLGILFADGPAAHTLTSVGLTVEVVERALAAELARVQADRPAG